MASRIIPPEFKEEIDTSLDTWIPDLMPKINEDYEDLPAEDRDERRTYYITYSNYINRPRDDGFHRRQVPNFKYLFPNTEEVLYADKDVFYPYLYGEMEDISVAGDRSVQKVVTKLGSGDAVPADAFVTIHFSAYYYANGMEAPFDSTWERRRPYKFRLNTVAVVQGLNRAVSSMKLGEISRFLLKPSAFFEKGLPPRVPENANVMFIVKLVAFQQQSESDEFYVMTAKDRFYAAFSLVAQVAEQEHEEGQEHMEHGRWREALHCYSRMDFMVKTNKRIKEDQASYNHWVFTIESNAAKCCIELGYLMMADSLTSNLIRTRSTDPEGLFLKGRVQVQLGKYEAAIKYLSLAQQLAPDDEEIKRLLGEVREEQDERHAR